MAQDNGSTKPHRRSSSNVQIWRKGEQLAIIGGCLKAVYVAPLDHETERLLSMIDTKGDKSRACG